MARKSIRRARPASPVETPRRIAMLICPGVAPLDVAGPMQVFGLANFLAKQPLYDLVTVATAADPLPTGLGFALLPACAMAALPLPVDTLLVSGGARPETVIDPAIIDWLREATPQARRFGAVCTGAFILGSAGLIGGKRVTTHWAMAEELARRHPTTKVDIDSIFIRDGNLYTTAGIAAGIDLALGLVEEDHGRVLALKVARYLVVSIKRSGGQAQFSLELQAQFSSIPAIEKIQLWCREHPQADLGVAVLAKRVAMSPRNFVRAFRDSTGRTPGEFVRSLRLQAARRLLEESDLPLKAVAERCGFGSSAALRRTFLHYLGVSPIDYRDEFRAGDIAPRATSREKKRSTLWSMVGGGSGAGSLQRDTWQRAPVARASDA